MPDVAAAVSRILPQYPMSFSLELTALDGRMIGRVVADCRPSGSTIYKGDDTGLSRPAGDTMSAMRERDSERETETERK